jgi:hypothetical protein
MPVTITLVDKEVTQERIRRKFKMVLTGSYDATNGQTVDLTAATDPNKLGRKLPPSKPLPTNEQMEVVGEPLGFTAEMKQAAASPTLKNFVLRIFNIATAAELTTTTYPAGALNNAVYVDIITKRRAG